MTSNFPDSTFFCEACDFILFILFILQAFIIVEFDTTLLTSSNNVMNFNVSAYSGGEEADSSNNIQILTVQLLTQYSINIIGLVCTLNYSLK